MYRRPIAGLAPFVYIYVRVCMPQIGCLQRFIKAYNQHTCMDLTYTDLLIAVGIGSVIKMATIRKLEFPVSTTVCTCMCLQCAVSRLELQ